MCETKAAHVTPYFAYCGQYNLSCHICVGGEGKVTKLVKDPLQVPSGVHLPRDLCETLVHMQ